MKKEDDVVCSFFPSSLFGWVVRFSRRLTGSGGLRAGDRALAAIEIKEEKKRWLQAFYFFNGHLKKYMYDGGIFSTNCYAPEF